MKKLILTSLIASSLISTNLIAHETNEYNLSANQKIAFSLMGAGLLVVASTETVKAKSINNNFEVLMVGVISIGAGSVFLMRDSVDKKWESALRRYYYSRLKSSLTYARVTGNLPLDKSLMTYVNSSNFSDTDSDIEKVKKTESMLKSVEIIAKDIISNSNSEIEKINENLQLNDTQTKLEGLLGDDMNSQNITFINKLLSISILGTL